MSKHTPGPWEVEYGENGGAIEIFAPLTPVSKPGGIGTVVRRRGISMPTSEEGKANARLIASAPALLSALKALIQVADSTTVEFDAARAAIAKAEGKS